MREYRNSYYNRNRKQYRKKTHKMRMLMTGIAVGIFLLLIYLIVMVFALIANTIEYQDAKREGHVMGQEAVSGSGNDENGTVDKDAVQEGGSSEDDTVKVDNSDSGIVGGSTDGDGHDLMMSKLRAFAQSHDFSVSAYPDEMIELLIKNPETEEFVLNYPLKKDSVSREGLEECLGRDEVPLLMQWDSRWGYYEYGDGVIGMTGCGPTCLSMVAVHLLQNPELTPVSMADYADRNGYYADGIGTAWTFMSQGAKAFGLKAQEVPLDENVVMRYLQQGKPIICAMGPGDFTDSGHFIVFTGVEDGKIKVNDPNSRERSEKLWEFEDIKYQIKNMWVYSVR